MPGNARPPSWTILWTTGSMLLWLLYTLVFVTTTDTGVAQAAGDAFANVAPLAGLAAIVHIVLKARVMSLPVAAQAVVHAMLAAGFALTWYALVIVMLAFVDGLRGRGFAVQAFSGVAFTWQAFQGLILYGLVAATCYAIRGGRAAAAVTLVGDASAPLERYLVRDGDGMQPIDVGDIVTITGAQDYAEVATERGRHLVRMSLGEFERRLDGATFLRVHRSSIINFRRLVRTEPAGGGRMIAHMANGEVVPVSRAGAQLLRSLAV